ncbi:MAG: GDP-mannose 4,6-dehydratase [Candidatus Omnitrophica bacterium]|nr:GDP-mannose 4,6-dehydratase [Candidatus Omnitrophota bacterium]
MEILITGGAGFIGSHLAEELLKDKTNEVYIIDNLSTGKLENINHLIENPRFHYVIDTILNEEVVDKLIAECKNVYHLAAAVGVKLIMDKPLATIETNVKGTEVVLRIANKYKRKVLIASSSEIYGNHIQHILKEDDNRVFGPVKKWRWAYASSKTIDEYMALAYYIEKKLPVIIVRLFNTVGPRQTAAYGMVIPNFVESALLGKPITVYGDGKQTRSFTYVKDVVRAMIDLMGRPRAVGDVFNIGSGNEISINELAKKIKKLANSNSKIVHISYEKAYGKGFDDMKRRTPDISKIKRLIGYKPKTSLDEIIQEVIEYFKQ